LRHAFAVVDVPQIAFLVDPDRRLPALTQLCAPLSTGLDEA
jgi:hypothetical protein